MVLIFIASMFRTNILQSRHRPIDLNPRAIDHMHANMCGLWRPSQHIQDATSAQIQSHVCTRTAYSYSCLLTSDAPCLDMFWYSAESNPSCKVRLAMEWIGNNHLRSTAFSFMYLPTLPYLQFLTPPHSPQALGRDTW